MRNTKVVKVDWRFSTADARIKLKRLYPKINDRRTLEDRVDKYHRIENNTRISEAISKIQEHQDELKSIIK